MFEPSRQLHRNIDPELTGIAIIKNQKKDKQSLPLKEARWNRDSPKFLTSSSGAATTFDINSDEEQRLKLEEDARYIDLEIQEAEHLAELRRKKAAVKARLDAMGSRRRRNSAAFSSPSKSIG